jgi:hypothetical protein
MQTVVVNVSFIKEAYASACESWKEKLVAEFPEIEFHPFKKGVLVESNKTSLVVYVTKDTLGPYFSGVVVRADDSRPIGYVSSNFCTDQGHIYTKGDINVKEVLGL